ncbi:AEL090Cp [Eremothecium gossypii ATCC 10895]|uniref:AEL090Cp n=1 Tax=Eremothecium gossypii (strain ATCC 10895 / CBS 109.51 / FGSC 9923 / NRRL Y-1056) TaxID=284811 RepID=Q757V2_EREGS|nr:AEL090Cp [Eremothecium gossypii ATCC 10895]AAS52595.2 AEL090Cp [Eremothecium gossypii ATCC 10895]AEY96897.1 FAEL090Cp [Eremothecium gossypii FDAG1]
MKRLECHSSEADCFRISLTTSNCAKQIPLGSNDYLLQRAIFERLLSAGVDYDLYAIGFQELLPIWDASCPLQTKSCLRRLVPVILQRLNSGVEDTPEVPVDRNVQHSEADSLLGSLERQAIGDTEQSTQNAWPSRQVPVSYRFVACNAIGAVGLMLFAKEDLKVEVLRTCNVRTGALGSSLKGSTAIQVQLSNSRCSQKFTFITSHFAAKEGPDKLAQRIKDYHTTMRTFDKHLDSFQDGHVFFFGDLNFRISPRQPTDLQYSDQPVIDHLLATYDELNRERTAGTVFEGFEEAKINFPPSYKYIFLQDNLNYDYTRQPSWCDRILYKNDPKRVRVHRYASIDRRSILNYTDHEPVTLDVSVSCHTQFVPMAMQNISPQSTMEMYVGDVTDILLMLFSRVYYAPTIFDLVVLTIFLCLVLLALFRLTV